MGQKGCRGPHADGDGKAPRHERRGCLVRLFGGLYPQLRAVAEAGVAVEPELAAEEWVHIVCLGEEEVALERLGSGAVAALEERPLEPETPVAVERYADGEPGGVAYAVCGVVADGGEVALEAFLDADHPRRLLHREDGAPPLVPFLKDQVGEVIPEIGAAEADAGAGDDVGGPVAVIEDTPHPGHGGGGIAESREPRIAVAVLRIEDRRGGEGKGAVAGGEGVRRGTVGAHPSHGIFRPVGQRHRRSERDTLGGDRFERRLAPPFDSAEVHPPAGHERCHGEDVVVDKPVLRRVVVAHPSHRLVLLEVHEVKSDDRDADAEERLERRQLCEGIVDRQGHVAHLVYVEGVAWVGAERVYLRRPEEGRGEGEEE